MPKTNTTTWITQEEPRQGPPSIAERIGLWLARRVIEKMSERIHDEGIDAGRAIAAQQAQDAEPDRLQELAETYLSGITDGVAIAVQEPGTPPQMMNAPKGPHISTLQLWKAIDNADIVRRGIALLPGDRPMDVEGVQLRADQLRSLLKPKG